MIVVDANIISYLWIPGHESFKSRELLVKDPDWWVPALYKSEMQSVLLLHVRKQIIEYEVAVQLMTKIENQFKFHVREIPSNIVLKLGSQTKCSAYDCEYAGLSLMLGCPLITYDKKLLNTFPQFASTAVAFLEDQN
ncbi:MAG: type II toxin-antitoxin system VapC family toxin [Saprospiraceae bacterium]|uniref:Type II toxin-antitoxin system VapC family toxin n=1 Tax=Candidatus Opimibacter skivensis TaxID=2982028 RepID=A0A9D7SSS1_9BACT|nr:type II toxin-antitoxin system VapC family toxin [Candidatus Opimibacter skivensis]